MTKTKYEELVNNVDVARRMAKQGRDRSTRHYNNALHVFAETLSELYAHERETMNSPQQVKLT